MSATSKPWLIIALVWTAAILAVNSVSVAGAELPYFAGADKLTHAGMYGVAAFAWRSAARSRSVAASWWVVIAMAIVGALDEYRQTYVPGRQSDAVDWLADVGGVFLGVAMWRLLTPLARKGAGA